MTQKTQNQTYIIGQSFTLSSISSDLHWSEESQISDYEFTHWTETEEDKEPFYSDKSIITINKTTSDLYAQWDYMKTYCTYGQNYGPPLEGGHMYYRFIIDKRRPYTILTPDQLFQKMEGFKRKEYEISSWNTKPDGSGEIIPLDKTFTNITSEISVYAQWKEILSFKFTYDNGINELIMVGYDGTEYRFNTSSRSINRHLQYCDSNGIVAIPYSNIVELQNKSNLIEVNDVDGNITSIGRESFINCYNLSSINCPNVTSIEWYAFVGCSNLSTVDFTQRTLTSIPTLEAPNAFLGLPSNYQIKVPSSLYDEWIKATYWSTIASHIVAV